MIKLTENMLIEIMRDEYAARLNEVMQETDMFDKRGNMVIRKGLKVRHKDTQYEYTVDDVMGSPGEELTVKLRAPDQPRFSSDVPGDEEVITSSKKDKDVLQEIDPPSINVDTQDDTKVSLQKKGDENLEDVFVIDQEEFEKEYEVK